MNKILLQFSETLRNHTGLKSSIYKNSIFLKISYKQYLQGLQIKTWP